MCTSPIRQFAPTFTCTSPRPEAPTSNTAAPPSGELTCFFGEVKGLVVGAFGEGSVDLHAGHLKNEEAGPQKGKRGQ